MSGKKDRLKKKLARKKNRLENITPTKPVKSVEASNIFNTPDPKQKRGSQKSCVLGSCEDGNLRAKKSTPSKGLKKERTKANLSGKGLPQKRKKLQAQIAELEAQIAELERKKMSSDKKPQFTNPRLL